MWVGCALLGAEEFAAAIIPIVAPSTWLIVLALGLMLLFPPFATEFLRILLVPAPAPLVLSLLVFRGRGAGVVVI